MKTVITTNIRGLQLKNRQEFCKNLGIEIPEIKGADSTFVKECLKKAKCCKSGGHYFFHYGEKYMLILSADGKQLAFCTIAHARKLYKHYA